MDVDPVEGEKGYIDSYKGGSAQGYNIVRIKTRNEVYNASRMLALQRGGTIPSIGSLVGLIIHEKNGRQYLVYSYSSFPLYDLVPP